MTDPVERARALLAKATKGPLYAVEAGTTPHDGMNPRPETEPECWDWEGYKIGDRYTVSTLPDRSGWNTDGGYAEYSVSKADAELWAAAPTLLAELADEVERLRASLARVADGEWSVAGPGYHCTCATAARHMLDGKRPEDDPYC